MQTGLDIAALRSAVVLVPLISVAALWMAVADVKVRGAAVLALLWCVVSLLPVNALAVRVGWWSFGTDGLEWFEVPVDVVFGWALLWGAVPILLSRWVNPLPVVAGLLVADVLVMGGLEPLVVLTPSWWWGEVLAVLACLFPATALGMLTASRRALRCRVMLQMVLFASLLVFVIPTLTFVTAGRSWHAALTGIGGPLDSVIIQVIAVLGIVAVRAVRDFAIVGHGTPFPWDPPTRLVTSGPYAYVANPMQLCAVLILVSGAVLFGEPLLLLAALTAAAFSSGIAAWNETSHLAARFGPAWNEHRSQVRNWVPRWHARPDRAAGTLYASVTCDPCSAVGPWFAGRSSEGLVVAAAEDHHATLRRVRYESADGCVVADGTRAIGCALEHLTLGWAVLGWVMRAPVLASVIALVTDACGGAPRTIPRRMSESPD
ncbi:methyltransferase [Rhodococcus sp. IEGM 1354]|uniref:methyltransferase family protein n=1 Tax=Rhodococcus sp. IEGM 1354 TaxID=3047088 RepID=UPI0024B68A50|nr:methyltransferase [Rhodococcus sp. IEGM 1354]MDI9930514.1 methyltransferase [Rhodococcus sp. IEGM 1354]